MDLTEVQLRQEAASVGRGVDRYRARVDEGGHAATGPGLRYIRSLVEPLTASIAEWQALVEDAVRTGNRSALPFGSLAPLLADASPEELAYLTLREAVDGSGTVNNASYTSLVVTLGGLVEEHLAWTAAMGQDDLKGYLAVVARGLASSTSEHHRRAVARHVLRSKAGHQPWPVTVRAQVGTHLVERLIASTGHFSKVSIGAGRRARSLLVMAPEALDALERAHDRAALLLPDTRPMVVPPLAWDVDGGGGYLELELPLVKPSPARDHPQSVPAARVTAVSERVVDALNAVQSVPWQVNHAVLGVLRRAWERGDRIAGLPDREVEPLPAKPVDIATNEEARRDWKRRASVVYAARGRVVSKRVAVMSTIAEAEEFGQYERIWFPYQVDWRGRMYPRGGYLQPQGDDMARSLLRFAEGKPLGPEGWKWLAIHLANCWGYDKVGLSERVHWTLDHSADIQRAAMGGSDDTEWWTQADKPWSFLAACFEWLGYCMAGEDYVSHLPVHVDGSCNGLQHFAAMLRDEVGGAAVNLVPSDGPADVYQQVADAVTATLIDETVHPAALVLDQWPEGVPRSIVKRPVMTVPYGVTRIGMAQQIRDELRSGALFKDQDQEVSQLLASHVQDAVSQVLQSAAQAMTWLQDCAGRLTEAGVPVQWETPAGMSVVQDYRVTGGHRIAVRVGGRQVYVTLAFTTGRADIRKQRNGISPNFVHSMDATHLVETVLLAVENDVTTLGAVHDSYATLAADMPTLAACLRLAFVELYRTDRLAELAEHWRAQGVDIPDPPEGGALDIEAVLGADYFFA